MRRALLTAALTMGVGVTSAQPPTSWRADDPPVGTTRLAQLGEAADPRSQNDRNQAWALLGREDKIVYPRKPVCDLAPGTAMEIIANQARDAQIVIINEAHFEPQHRAFIADVAASLAPLGYRTFAAEAFAPWVAGDSPLPKMGDGYYVQEPSFGFLLRRARSLDYKFVPYEAMDVGAPSEDFVDALNAREAGQAANLIQRIFLQDRSAKVLIHVGHSHNLETTERVGGNRLRPREIVWMARRLKDTLKIDPLTIDQTTFDADRSGVCIGTGPGGGLPTGRDMFVAHAPPQFERNRPAWRIARGENLVDPPKGLAPGDQRAVYEARYAIDPEDAVPIDRILVEPGERVPLSLPVGKYKVRAWTQASGWSRTGALIVRAQPSAPAPKAKVKKKR
jgi:hypothetical protein